MANLSRRLLSRISPASLPFVEWRDFVRSLFIEPERKVSVPRIKKVKVPHSVTEGSKHCEVCGKKPRNPAATCPGPKNTLTTPEATP